MLSKVEKFYQVTNAITRIDMTNKEKVILISIVIMFFVYVGYAIHFSVKNDREDKIFRLQSEINNEQIVEKSRFCMENGLNAEIVWHGAVDGKWPEDIRCTPETDTTDLIQGKKSQAVIIN